MAKFHTTSFEEVLDRKFGPVGTPERDEHDKKIKAYVDAYRIGEAIKNARTKQKLTQEQLGERIGVKRAQISSIEHGNCLSFSLVSRVFQALGFRSAHLVLDGGAEEVALW